jgi:hypothetical protein
LWALFWCIDGMGLSTESVDGFPGWRVDPSPKSVFAKAGSNWFDSQRQILPPRPSLADLKKKASLVMQTDVLFIGWASGFG